MKTSPLGGSSGSCLYTGTRLATHDLYVCCPILYIFFRPFSASCCEQACHSSMFCLFDRYKYSIISVNLWRKMSRFWPWWVAWVLERRLCMESDHVKSKCSIIIMGWTVDCLTQFLHACRRPLRDCLTFRASIGGRTRLSAARLMTCWQQHRRCHRWRVSSERMRRSSTLMHVAWFEYK